MGISWRGNYMNFQPAPPTVTKVTTATTADAYRKYCARIDDTPLRASLGLERICVRHGSPPASEPFAVDHAAPCDEIRVVTAGEGIVRVGQVTP
jgi:hypothetical protein